MDFDLSKENIQPLRGGRNVSQLGAALQAQVDMDHQKELSFQRSEFEKLIKTYTGDDPLENWYNYISWVEQSYPKQGYEGNLLSLLEHCLKLFETDKRYTEDRRLCRLFIKYIDHQQNRIELYHMMYAQGLCRSCTDMYKAWAYYYEAAGDFRNAHRVFECGKRELAQPYGELQSAHENLVVAAGRHIIYGPNEQDLSEKRLALTSLGVSKSTQVSDVQRGSVSRHGAHGVSSSGRSNVSIPIYEDKGEEIRTNEVGPLSIVAASKRQEVPKENTVKPGPWATIPTNKKQISHKQTTSFTVREDSGDFSEQPKITGFVTATLENYSDWIVSLTIPEPKDDRMLPMYPKGNVYSEINTEYSLEELRGRRYIRKNQYGCVHKPLGNVPDPTNIVKDKKEENISDHIPEKNNSNASSKAENRSDGTTSGSLNFQHCSIEENNCTFLNFDLWNSLHCDTLPIPSILSLCPQWKFSIYEQSDLMLHGNIEPKGSTMKTPFKDLNAEELAETGSRGGMDVAAAAPVDSAKRLPLYDDDTISFEKNAGITSVDNFTCNTQMFGFNLNVMQVSTPENKLTDAERCGKNSAKITAKQLFSETVKEDAKHDKILSTIFEETKSCGQSSSGNSNNAVTKSSLFSNNIKQNDMTKISEEHNSYLAQNLKANAALRSSSLGDFMDLYNSNSLTLKQKVSLVDDDVETAMVPNPVYINPLNFVPSDPFKQTLIEQLLDLVCFPGPHVHGYIWVNNIPKILVRKESVYIGSDKYVIDKQLGKGTYGTVFRGIDVRTGNIVAMKIQKPPNKWEFYICRELQARLFRHPLREHFMDVKIGYFSDQASVLISEFMPCGSLLDVANSIKQKSGRPMKESLCIHFCLEMLKIVHAMHEVKIIHADIKPDNFLVQLFRNDFVGLQLIDFGCSIDMSLFPPRASFTRKVTTEDFVCCEMKDNRPWNYHTDLFCIAATAHVLLFEKYIQMQKKDGHWSILNRLPRYARLDLWNMFFSTLLNQQDEPADSVSLQAMLEDSLNHKFDDYHNELRYLTNILKNR